MLRELVGVEAGLRSLLQAVGFDQAIEPSEAAHPLVHIALEVEIKDADCGFVDNNREHLVKSRCFGGFK